MRTLQTPILYYTSVTSTFFSSHPTQEMTMLAARGLRTAISAKPMWRSHAVTDTVQTRTEPINYLLYSVFFSEHSTELVNHSTDLVEIQQEFESIDEKFRQQFIFSKDGYHKFEISVTTVRERLRVKIANRVQCLNNLP